MTLSLHSNYGGILQAYALQTVLERMGHEVVVWNIQLLRHRLDWKDLCKRIVKKMMGYDIPLSKYQETSIISRNIVKFRQRNIKERCVGKLEEISPKEIDCIVVGSDQVWRPIYFKSQWRTVMKNAFLAFTENWKIRRMSYAASFGVDEWEFSEDETAECCKAAQAFDAISVREQSGIRLVHDCLNREAIQVLDPTMLLCKEDYQRLLDNSNVERKGAGVLVYILDKSNEKIELVERVAKEKGMPFFSVNNSMTNSKAPLREKILPSVETWLKGFNEADFVITDSFHACVFSVIFRKPFVVIANQGRGASRFDFFSNTLGLNQNVLVNPNDYSSSVDYTIPDSVYRELETWRTKSFKFLTDNL